MNLEAHDLETGGAFISKMCALAAEIKVASELLKDAVSVSNVDEAGDLLGAITQATSVWVQNHKLFSDRLERVSFITKTIPPQPKPQNTHTLSLSLSSSLSLSLTHTHTNTHTIHEYPPP